MPLDPQARDFLDRLAEAKLPPIQEQTIAQARAQMDFSTRFLGPLPQVGRVEDREIPGPGGTVRVRIITPQAARRGTTAGACVLPRRRVGPRQHRVARRGLSRRGQCRRVRSWSPSIIDWLPSIGSPRRPKTRTPP